MAHLANVNVYINAGFVVNNPSYIWAIDQREVKMAGYWPSTFLLAP